MNKLLEHKKYIKGIIEELENPEKKKYKLLYTTKFCKEYKLFASLKTGEYNERNLYAVIQSGLLKTKREMNGTSTKLAKIYFTGEALAEALKKYYNL